MSEKKTIKVQIVIAVNNYEECNAVGDATSKIEDLRRYASDPISNSQGAMLHMHLVTVEVPVPTMQQIDGVEITLQ